MAQKGTTQADVVFGGTFDPPHLGHLIVASEVCSTLDTASLLFVPTGQNPLKGWSPLVSGAHRLKMLERIADEDDRFSVSSIEIDHGGPSRTVETIERLIRSCAVIPNPWIVIGDELLPGLSRWYRIEDLADIARFIVVTRDIQNPSTTDQRMQITPDTSISIRRVANPLVEISSREIRNRIAENRSIRYLVPESIYGYIEQNKLYR